MSSRSAIHVAVVAVCAALLAAAAPAGAALVWRPVESIPAGGFADFPQLNLGADGTGVLVGFPSAGLRRQAVRPPGGPLAAAQALPGGIGAAAAPPLVSGWFADGSSLWADPAAHRVVFRPAGAGAAFGVPQDLGAGHGVGAIATTTTGDALIGFDGTVGVAYRSPGPGGTVDVANEQTFGPGRLLGVALDPAGGAVVAFIPQGSNSIMQAVRDPGTSSFSAPVAIPPRPGVAPYRVQMASDPSGDAVLAWIGGAGGTLGYGTEMTVSQRLPGGAFAAPQVVGTDPTGDVKTILPGATADGNGFAAWGALVAPSACSNTSSDADYGVAIATAHNGVWGSGVPVGGSTWPVNTVLDGVAAVGGSVALAYETRTDTGARCASADVSTELDVRTGTVTATGIVLDPPVTIAPVAQNALGQFLAPVFEGLSINPAGGALVGVSRFAAAGKVWDLHVREDPAAAVPGAGATPAGGAGGQPAPAPGPSRVLPIVPRKLVTIVPLNPYDPVVSVLCPPDYADECAFRMAVYAAFGATPQTAATRARLLGSGKLTLRPGKKGKVRLRLNPAGRKLLRSGKQRRVRIVVTVTAGARRGSFTAAASLKRPRAGKPRS